jgi:hypothetical protein
MRGDDPCDSFVRLKHMPERARRAEIFAAAVEGDMRTLKMDGMEKIMMVLTDIKMVRSG